MRYRKMNRYERREFQRVKLTRDLQGSGLYVYRNNSDAELLLPKPGADGVRSVAPRAEFRGDDYFKGMVRTNELIQVREVEAPQRGDCLTSEKLILDQPDAVTADGPVEHHVVAAVPPKRAVSESRPAMPKLLVEDPLDGVDILTD